MRMGRCGLPVLAALILVLGVLARVAADLVGGILCPVEHHLLLDGLEEIDVQFVGEANEVDEDVGHLVSNGSPLCFIEFALVARDKPLETLSAVARFFGVWNLSQSRSLTN
jgi:hypothetical protein